MNHQRIGVRRPADGELVGFVVATDQTIVATTTFGVELARFAGREQAERFLCERGLAILAERWWLWSPDSRSWRPAILIEAGVDWVRVGCGRDPTTREQFVLRGGDVHLLRHGRQPGDEPLVKRA